MSYRSQLFLLVLALTCSLGFSHSTPTTSTYFADIDDIDPFFQITDLEDLSTMMSFAEELKTVYQQIEKVREMVPKSSKETIEVMDLFDTIDTSPVCNRCLNYVEVIRKQKKIDVMINILKKTFNFICRLIKIDKDVCQGAISSFGDVLLHALVDRTLNPAGVCQRMLLCPKTYYKEHVKDYVKEILKDKPANTSSPAPTKKATYRVLQLADPHVDLQYESGANAYCTQPLCCRAENGAPLDASKASQHWGTLSQCDIPMRTFDQFLQFASEKLDIDMIIWTGDNIAHDIWNQSQENQTVNTYDITQEIFKYFPNTPVYPMFGNHEAFPANQFDFFGNKSDWLLEELSDMWSKWLDEQALETFKKHSYYSMVNQKYNVKIIALDTEACDTADFYLILDPTDPLGELEWLRKELYDSESKNQSVFIMGHIPPGNFVCASQWSARYRALVDRFSHIIRGQFFGHTHNDEVEVVRSYADGSPVGSVFIAPSFTTYSNLNPSFRVFEMDAETSQPINMYQYRLDLNKWNQNLTGPIEWDVAYNLLDQYGVPDMSFESIDKIVKDMKDPSSKTVLEYDFHFTSGGAAKTKLSPREIQHYYCAAKHSVAEDILKCLGLKIQVHDLMAYASQLLPGAWHYSKC